MLAFQYFTFNMKLFTKVSRFAIYKHNGTLASPSRAFMLRYRLHNYPCFVRVTVMRLELGFSIVRSVKANPLDNLHDYDDRGSTSIQWRACQALYAYRSGHFRPRTTRRLRQDGDVYNYTIYT